MENAAAIETEISLREDFLESRPPGLSLMESLYIERLVRELLKEHVRGTSLEVAGELKAFIATRIDEATDNDSEAWKRGVDHSDFD